MSTRNRDVTPPRVVTPTGNSKYYDGVPRKINVSSEGMEGEEEEGTESPLLHRPTAITGGLTTTMASPMKTIDSLRYALNSKQPSTESMIPKSPSSPVKNRSAISSSKLKAAHHLALQPTTGTSGSSGNVSGSDHQREIAAAAAAAASSGGGGSTIRRHQDPNAYKIFLLLLQPQSKIFELIQLLYSPYDTTVGNILELIPVHATERALGSQEYIGLCRPKTQEELLDTEQLASDAPSFSAAAATSDAPSAKITLGEILVAIPLGYSGADVSSLSKQILSNPKIVKLLKRADPLAPNSGRRRRRSSGRHRRSSSSKLRAAEQVHVLERHDELEEEFPQNSQHGAASSDNVVNKQEAERLMQIAMEHAAAEAAAANAAIPGGGAAMGRSKSILVRNFNSNNNSTSVFSESQSLLMMDDEPDESLDDSFSSWSKSFDASFSVQSSICSGVSKRAIRRKYRQAKRMRILQRSAIAVFGLMVLFYMMDPSRPGNDPKQAQQQHRSQNYSEEKAQTPMGIMGIFQCLFLLLTLYKVERLVHTTRAAQHYEKTHNGGPVPAVYMSEERKCPFLKAAARAMKRFKHKYNQRLSKATSPSQSTKQQNHPELSQKLRSFSLKAASIQDLDNDGR